MSAMKRLAMAQAEWEELHGAEPFPPACHYCGKPEAAGRCETAGGMLLYAFCYPFCPERSRSCACGREASPLTRRCPVCWAATVAARTPEEAQAIGRAIVAPYLGSYGPSLDERMAQWDRMWADDRRAGWR